MKDGLHKEWYDDGGLCLEGNFKGGKQDGLWRSWDEDGQLRSEEHYKAGELVSIHEWDKQGNLFDGEPY